jgi:hypothetical protein
MDRAMESDRTACSDRAYGLSAGNLVAEAGCATEVNWKANWTKVDWPKWTAPTILTEPMQPGDAFEVMP